MSETVAPAPRPPRRMGLLGSFFLFVLLLLTLGGAAGIVAVLMPGPSAEKKTVIVPRMLGLRGIGGVLADHGLVYHPMQFAVAARLIAPRGIKAGEYAFTPHMSVLDIIALLRSGKSIIHKLVVPEGWTNADIARLLEAEPLLTDAVGPLPPEGMLYPATYHFMYGDSRAALVAQMEKLARSTLDELWAGRDKDLPFTTPEQAVTLASIVEKETSVGEERARIAGVFVNRMRLGMRLQSDPTVIYALTRGQAPLKRALTLADLAFASPYNTYASDGLPPGAIANPGRAALAAVLKPEKNDFLYFVADGSGGHAFATSLDAHNRNVSQWRKLQRD